AGVPALPGLLPGDEGRADPLLLCRALPHARPLPSRAELGRPAGGVVRLEPAALRLRAARRTLPLLPGARPAGAGRGGLRPRPAAAARACGRPLVPDRAAAGRRPVENLALDKPGGIWHTLIPFPRAVPPGGSSRGSAWLRLTPWPLGVSSSEKG